MNQTKTHPWELFADRVAVLTAKHGEKEGAMPASWIVVNSYKPPLISVNVSPLRHTYGLMKGSKKFALNLLADDQADLSRYAASCSGRDTDKFKKIKKFYGETGVPLIEGCLTCIECKVVDIVKEGDHDTFTGEIVNSYTDESKKPLLLFKKGYFSIGKPLGGWLVT